MVCGSCMDTASHHFEDSSGHQQAAIIVVGFQTWYQTHPEAMVGLSLNVGNLRQQTTLGRTTGQKSGVVGCYIFCTWWTSCLVKRRHFCWNLGIMGFWQKSCLSFVRLWKFNVDTELMLWRCLEQFCFKQRHFGYLPYCKFLWCVAFCGICFSRNFTLLKVPFGYWCVHDIHLFFGWV